MPPDATLTQNPEIAGPGSTMWLAWVDGTARPNPGRIGIGHVLVSPSGLRAEHSDTDGRSGCNNEAEVRAILGALAAAAAAGARRLTLHSDSRFAVDCLNGLDSTEVPRLVDLLATVRAAMDHFDQVRLVWLPRHRNAEADRIARAALGLAPKPAPAKRKRRR